VDKKVGADYMVDATEEPARDLLGAPTSAAAVLSVNYHKKTVEEEDKGHNRSLELLQAGDTYIVRRKTFWSQSRDQRRPPGNYTGVETIRLEVALDCSIEIYKDREQK
jgi:hypothetical protein